MCVSPLVLSHSSPPLSAAQMCRCAPPSRRLCVAHAFCKPSPSSPCCPTHVPHPSPPTCSISPRARTIERRNSSAPSTPTPAPRASPRLPRTPSCAPWTCPRAPRAPSPRAGCASAASSRASTGPTGCVRGSFRGSWGEGLAASASSARPSLPWFSHLSISRRARLVNSLIMVVICLCISLPRSAAVHGPVRGHHVPLRPGQRGARDLPA